MAFTGHEHHVITLTDADTFIDNYAQTVQDGAVKAHFFGKDDLLKLLNQTDCVGLRMYYAINEGQEQQLVIFGVNTAEEDLRRENFVLDRSFPCPPYGNCV